MMYCDSSVWMMSQWNSQPEGLQICEGCVWSFLKPILLNATIRFHLKKYLVENKDLIQCLLYSTYVDDIISGGCNEDEAFCLYTESKKIFHEGGFNLRKFLTNSK